MVRLRPDELAGKAWRVLGWLVLAVDGSRFECPRTTANEEGLGCAGRNKTAPQLFHTLLQHVGTGLPWDFRIGPGTDSERRHLDDMLADLPEQTLLTADAGFTGYDLCSQLIDANQRFVLRIGGNKTLLENLEDDESNEDIVYLWPQKQRSQSQPALKLRRICFRSAGSLPVVLITNVLDPDVLSDEDAQAIYQSRWGIEVYFRHLKQTMGFTTLKSRTPMTAMNEHHWRLISFWTLQHIAVRHQQAAGQAARRFSASAGPERNPRCPATDAAKPPRHTTGPALADNADRHLPAPRPQNHPRVASQEERHTTEPTEMPNSNHTRNQASQRTWIQVPANIVNGVGCHPTRCLSHDAALSRWSQ